MEFINNFKVLRKLGAGGYGEVYLAEHTKSQFKFNRLVALKNVDKTNSTIDDFSNEVEILAKLHHPKICQIYDVGEVDNSYFIVMEYIEGLSLSEFIAEAEKKKIEIGCSELMEILDSILSALKYAHQAEPSPILHRDICPKNIMISKSGEVVLIDFGISDILKSNSETSLKGKPSYLPKKILSGEENYSFKTELYSVGVVLYEAFTGKKVYNEDDINLEEIEDDTFKSVILLLIRFDGNYDDIFKATEEILQSNRSKLRIKAQRIFNRKIIAEKTQQIRTLLKNKIPLQANIKTYVFLGLISIVGFVIPKTPIWENFTSQKTPLSIYKGKFVKIKPLSTETGIEFNEHIATSLTIKSNVLIRNEIDENGCKKRYKWLARRRDESIVEFNKIEFIPTEKPKDICLTVNETSQTIASAIIEMRRDGNYLYLRKLSGSSIYLEKEEKFQVTKR